MRVAFFGVSAWGNLALDALLERGVDVWRVFTRTESAPCPHFAVRNLAEEAAARGVPVVADRSPDDDPRLLRELVAAKVDLLLSCGYYKKIGDATIAAAGRAVNVHPSLLPQYRGGSPSNWAIVHGERTTGVTLHRMTSRFDAGEIFLQHAVPISAEDTSGTLRARQAVVTAQLVAGYVDALAAARAPAGRAQRLEDGRYFKAITKADARVDGSKTARATLDLIRGTLPWPGPWIEIGGERREVLRAHAEDGRPGHALRCTDGSLTLEISRAGVRERARHHAGQVPFGPTSVALN